MKKTYLAIASVLLFASTLNAQIVQPHAQLYPAAYNNIPVGLSSEKDILSDNRDEGDILWSDNFEDPTNWEFIAPIDGLNPAVNGWSIGNTNNSWANFQVMNTTGSYARFVNGNPNATPSTVVESDPFIFEYTGVIPDLTGVPAPHLEFKQYGARFFTNQEVQISVDGGNNWITVGSNTDIPPLTSAGGAAYPNTQTRRFNLTSAIAADPSNIKLRLYWDGALNGTTMNYIDYAWFIDDIQIVEGNANDLVLSNSNYNNHDPDVDFWNNLEYSIYDISQVRPLVFNAVAFNTGSEIQTGVTLQVNITDGNLYNQTISSESIILVPEETAYIELAPFTPPAVVGTYTITFTLLQDQEESSPANNTATRSFQISDGVFARDSGVIAGSSPAINADEHFGGPAYYISQDANLYCIGAAISSVSIPGTFIEFVVREPVATWPIIGSTDAYPIANTMLNGASGTNGNFTWFPMLDNEPLFLEADLEYIVAFRKYQGNEIASVSVSSGVVPAASSFVWGPLSTAGTPCDPCQIGANYMIRMGLSQQFCNMVSVNVEELETLNVQNLYPNPTVGMTTVEYTLLESSKVQMYLFDVMGRVVMSKDMGSQQVGEYRFEFDFSQVASGSYTFALEVNGKFTSQSLVKK